MSKLLVRVSDALYNSSDVLINGNKEKFTSNGRGSLEFNLESDDNVEIQIKRNHELLSPLWLVWGLLFFVISCFGIFDVPYSRRAPLTCVVNVIPGGDSVVQFMPNPNKDGTAVSIENHNCEVEVAANSLDDKLMKKRRKTLRIIKLLLWLALIATVVVVVVTKF